MNARNASGGTPDSALFSHSPDFYSSISVEECLETVGFYHVHLQECVYRPDDI